MREYLPMSSSDPTLNFGSVTKKYPLKRERTLKDMVSTLFTKQETPEVTAMDRVSFTIEKGETVGIVGKNGAGKSTMMKLIAGVTYPTSGSISVTGQVAPLIELGAGFHHELTGYENIFLNAAILGLHKKEIELVAQDIIAFSELQDFIHVPVKRYSTGMLMRLGFSVAVHTDADIYLIDEVLGVGDAEFQEKSFERLDELKQSGEKIIIYVSHNEEAVREFCERSLLIHEGKLVLDGDTDAVFERYHLITED